MNIIDFPTATVSRIEAQRTAHQAIIEKGRTILAAVKPKDATHAIIAELMVDDSDCQTDYFASHATRSVFLAWSKHGRDLFSEMRKAALLFPDTAHMGPGKDIWIARVVASQDIRSNGYVIWKGSYSPLHRSLTEDETGNQLTFSTEAEARAFAASLPEIESLWTGDDNSVESTFEWSFHCESFEHREKWSMGSGYYLGAKYSGWRISKTNAENQDVLEALATAEEPTKAEVVATETPAPAGAAVTPTEVQVTENTEKNGVEIRFPSKPPAFLLATLKALGWKWSKFSACWYRTATDEARKLAHDIASTWTATQA